MGSGILVILFHLYMHYVFHLYLDAPINIQMFLCINPYQATATDA